MQSHNVQRKTKRITSVKVGRGGRRGKTSGRGMKGQKSRAGGAGRPQIRDLIKKIPKRRGYGKNRAKTVYGGKEKAQGVNLNQLNDLFTDGEQITPKALLSKKLVRREKGRAPKVKILGRGELTKKFTIKGCTVSENAKKSIEAKGGSVAQ